MLSKLDGRNYLSFALWIFTIFILASGFAFKTPGQTKSTDIPPTLSDSLLKNYSLDELEQYRNLYMRRITRLERERADLRRKGIRDGEAFLSHNPDTKVGDKIMMRLAELYYEQAQDDFDKKMQEYDRLYSLYDRGEILQPPKEPQKDLSKPLNMYLSVIERYPQSELVDDAFFNIGFLLEETGHPDSARAYYNKILEDFPQSSLLPDVYMRIGEYYFNPPVNDIDMAISYYKKILDYRESPRYDEALYRLGWCYYRVNKYSDAITYFTLLADDINRTKKFDPLKKYTNPSLADESIEYIGLSFLEYGGPEKAAQYIEEIGGRDYGLKILKRIGDAYLDEKEDYQNAIIAYNLLLKLYPDTPIAPTIQNRVVQAYRRLGQEPLAYLARDILFSRYKQGSEWWQKNSDKEVRKRAYKLTESALRDNITVLLNRSQEAGQPELYQQIVIESRKYLRNFPKDSSAALIHWNMALTLDTRLKDLDAAYKEYVDISNLYWDTPYQKYAAQNAVAIARDAAIAAIEKAEKEAAAEEKVTISELKQQAGEKASRAFNFRQKMKLVATPLTPEEKRLASAYDNFIKLFPHAKETPAYLANAGALYYRHHQYRDALKYFNTLLKHFPGSQEVTQARSAILESYFGKADFRSAEIVARRIVYSDAPEDLKSHARRRLAESIYLNAEMLSDANRHLEAGNEYRRVVKEVPRSEFADLALFNAALEYDVAKEYMRAIETYNYLLATHPNSGYVLDAQKNLAFDYVELDDYHNAALTFERLSIIQPDENEARDALYNASLYFAKAEDWEQAIKANQTFIQRFPDDGVADDLAYEIAGFYRKLNEYDKAQSAYEKFIQGYPKSPRVVEAYYWRGRYLQEMGKNKEAIVELQRALAKSKELGKEGLDKNDYFAAESEFALAEVKLEEFEDITFRLPEAKMKQDKERKKDLLLEIVRHLGNCASYGTDRVYEATFKIGYAYQQFAETWAEQEIPTTMESTRRIVAQKEVYDAAALLFERAANAYRNSIRSLGSLAETYQKSLLDSLTKESAPVDSAAIIEQDSTLRKAYRWIGRAKVQLTLANYDEAELSLKSAHAVMNAPIPVGLGDFPRLVYRKQVLDIAVKPLITQTLEAYEKNLIEADSLNIESQWVELSKQKLIETKNIIPSQYSRLAMEGLGLLRSKFQEYDQVVNSNQKFESVLSELQTLSDDILNTIDFCKGTIDTSTAKYLQTINMAQDLGIQEEYIAGSKDSLLISLLNFGLKSDTLSHDARLRADRAREKYLKTNDPIFEEGLFTFESTFFSLRDLERATLEKGYHIAQNLKIDNLYAKNMVLHLVRFDPERYAGLLDLKVKETPFVSDTTWLASPTYFEGWTSPGFDASSWQKATFVVKDSVKRSDAIWFYLAQDSVSQMDTATVVVQLVPAKRVFFRKKFSVKGLPVSCKLNLLADQLFSLYFNGDLIHKVTSTDSAASTGKFDLSELLVNGTNVVAVEVQDLDGTANGLHVDLKLRSLPDWDAKVEMLRPELTSKQVQEKLIIEKGRIP